jgi:GcrA cell cycle regulator
MRATSWDLERIQLLTALWGSGATAEEIADRLGEISRSAVLGKIYRLRLVVTGDRDASVRDSLEPRKDGKGGIAAAKPPARVAAPSRRRSSKKPVSFQNAQPAPQRRGKSLLELTNDSCRWPHGRPGTSRFFFCGAAGADLEHGMPYCERHAQRAYQTDHGSLEKAPPIAPAASRQQQPAAHRSPFMAMIEPPRDSNLKRRAG